MERARILPLFSVRAHTQEHNLPPNTRYFPTGAEEDQVSAVFFLPPPLVLPASLVLKLMPVRAALEMFLTCMCVRG